MKIVRPPYGEQYVTQDTLTHKGALDTNALHTGTFVDAMKC